MKLSRRMISEFIMITLATIITAAGVFFFLMPSHLAVGSVSGLSIIVGNFIPLPISTITMIFNVGLLVVGFLLIGKEFGGKTASSVSKKTTCVLAGEDAGSKLVKAKEKKAE